MKTTRVSIDGEGVLLVGVVNQRSTWLVTTLTTAGMETSGCGSMVLGWNSVCLNSALCAKDGDVLWLFWWWRWQHWTIYI